MAPKRSAAAAALETTAQQELKKTRSAVDEAFNELLCPITQSLPLDPVTAKDGRVYERVAITEWLKKHKRSPMTNKAMGTELVPAVQVKNMIRGMVKSGALTGEKTDEWRKKLEEEEEVKEMRRRAEAGDGEAMFVLAIWYRYGKHGLEQDYAKAFEWSQKSHDAGHASGTSILGDCYLAGRGVEKHVAFGMQLKTSAAKDGSAAACCELGDWFAEGDYVLPKNMSEARRWYSKVASCALNDIAQADREEAAPVAEKSPPGSWWWWRAPPDAECGFRWGGVCNTSAPRSLPYAGWPPLRNRDAWEKAVPSAAALLQQPPEGTRAWNRTAPALTSH